MGEIGKMMMGGGEKVITLDDCTASVNGILLPAGITWGRIKAMAAAGYDYVNHDNVNSFKKLDGKVAFFGVGSADWDVANLQPSDSDQLIPLCPYSSRLFPVSMIAILK